MKKTYIFTALFSGYGKETAVPVHPSGSRPGPSKAALRARWRNGLTALAVLVGFCSMMMAQDMARQVPNTLTQEEKAAGWTLLFDGQTTAGWRGFSSDCFPSSGWEVKDGELRTTNKEGEEPGGGIVTIKQYGDFEFSFEWKLLTKGGNSGIKYFVNEAMSGGGSYAYGLEYQILDDENHEWMLEGRMQPNDHHTLGALYEFFPPSAENKKVNGLGEWNRSRIVSKGRHVEHWLNGRKLLEYERGGKAFMEMFEQSKWKDKEGFGLWEKGHIVITDHDSEIRFRNLKIREL